MNNEIIQNYINKNKINKKSLRNFCKEVFEYEIRKHVESEEMDNITLKILVVPATWNGCYIKARKQEEYHFIVINLFPYLCKKSIHVL